MNGWDLLQLVKWSYKEVVNVIYWGCRIHSHINIIEWNSQTPSCNIQRISGWLRESEQRVKE